MRSFFGQTDASRIPTKWFLDEQRDASGNTISYQYVSLDRNGDPCPAAPTDCAMYPSEILYASHPLLSTASNKIVFEYETRPDVRASWRHGYREVRGLRLARISMYASDCGDVITCPLLVRRYELSYIQSALNGESLLEKIALVGADDASRITLRTLEYGSRRVGWVPEGIGAITDIPDALDFVDSQERSRGTTIIDVNGDGFKDALARVDDLSRPSVFLGGPSGFTLDAAWSLAFASIGVDLAVKAGDRFGASTGVNLVDVNGDTRADVVIVDGTRTEVWLNTGTSAAVSPTACSPCGWVLSTELSASLQSLEVVRIVSAPPPAPQFELITGLDVTDPTLDNGVRFVDFNGDGLVDIIQGIEGVNSAGFTYNIIEAFVNTGTSNGWVKVTNDIAEIPRLVLRVNWSLGIQFLELNGDGLIDYIHTADRSQGATPRAYLGSPTGWVYDQEFSSSLVAFPEIETQVNRIGTGLVPVDYNGDGLVDFVRASLAWNVSGPVPTPIITRAALRNTGTGWEQDPSMLQSITDIEAAANIIFAIKVDLSAVGGGDNLTSGAQIHDVTGDGVADLLYARPQGPDLTAQKFAIAGDPRAEDRRLVRSTNALGEVTDIAWTYSSGFDNRLRDFRTNALVTPTLYELSVVLSVPTQLSKHDGRGNVHVTGVDYLGGANSENGFEGFARSTQQLPSGMRKETLHWREKGFNGRVLSEEIYDAADQLRVRTTYDWQRSVTNSPTLPGTTRVTQPSLELTLQETFDAAGTLAQWTGSRSRYDDRLNVIEVLHAPKVVPGGSGGGDTITTLTWIRDDAAGIWSVNDSIRVEGHVGPTNFLISETIFSYDNLPRGQVTRGLPTERRDWTEGTTYVSQKIQYDAFGNLVGLTDRNGKINTFEYAGPAKLYRTSATDPVGRTVSSEYDPRFGALLRDVNAGGIERRSEYDTFGRLAAVYYSGDDPTEPSIRYSYSDVGGASQSYQLARLIKRGRPERFRTTSYFDARGLIYQQDSDSANGQLIRQTKAFDYAGAVVAESRPFFSTDSSTESPVLRTTERDEFGKPLRIVDGDGLATSLTYVANQVVVTDRRSEQRFFTLDGNGNITESRHNDSVAGTDEITQYRYDESRQLVGLTDAQGSITTISYDGLGRRTGLVDANLGEFTYQYDNQGSLISQTAPDGGVTTFTYNDAGELIGKSLPDGSTQAYEYGAPGGTANSVGKLVRVDDAAGTLLMSYDARGNVIERRRTISAAQGADPTYVTGYAFDTLDRLTRLTYPDGYAVDYHYDPVGTSLVRVTDSDGRTLATDIVRNAQGQVESTNFGNGTSSQSSYDMLGRPLQIGAQASDGTSLQDLSYQYDNGHNITSIDDAVVGQLQSFDYDAVGRLLSATGSYGTELYRYDPTGGLLRKGELAFAADAQRPQRISCAMDAAVDPTAASCATHLSNGTANAFALAYDGRGNLTQKGDQFYEYDAENRLLRVSDAGGTLQQNNRYDAFGQRVVELNDGVETVTIDGIYQEYADTTVRHVMAGNILVSSVIKPKSSVQRIAQVSTPGGYFQNGLGLAGFAILVITAGGWRHSRRRRLGQVLGEIVGHIRRRPGKRGTALALLPFYLLALSQSALLGCSSGGSDDPVTSAKTDNATLFYYHADHLGSIQVVSDGSGQESERRQYRPYGDQHAWSQPAPVATEKSASFGGHRYDQATNLYYMGARHYDAQLGRFLSADVIVANPGDPRTLNRYAYAGGNPIRLSDPTGRAWYDPFVDAVTAIEDAVVSAANAVAAVANDIADWFEDHSEEIAFAAIIAAAVVLVIVSFGVASPILAGIMLGAALGALETTITHMANGGGIESLLGPLLVSVTVGAALGALGGATVGRFAQGLKSIGKSAISKAGASALTKVGARSAQGLGLLLSKGRALAKISYLAVTSANGRAENLGEIRQGIDFVGDSVADPLARRYVESIDISRLNGFATYPMTP